MGIVWLSRDNQLERQVALKFLSEQIFHDHALLADLKRETKRSLELTHPNIVRIHDFVQDARTACISMEYVDGETLSNLRVNKANHIFEVPDLEPLVAQWCEAMHYAHTYPRVVHCDLKPANLMLNVKGVLKITDFGIARSLSDSASRLTVTRSKSGTLVYMSPQQLNGDPPSVFDDIYSMGATLYELLTGKPPFYRGQIDRQIFDKTPPSIAARRTELGIRSPYIVPLEWEETIAGCLAKEPLDRPQSALGLLNRLNLVSPLRIENPIVSAKIHSAPSAPPTPGEFGLMQDDTALRSLGAGPGETNETDGARNVTPAPPAPPLTTSHGDMTPSVSRSSSRPLDIPVERTDRGRLRRRVAVTGIGIVAIVALWYLLSFISRQGAKPRAQSASTNVVTRFVPEKTPPVVSQPKTKADAASVPTATPIVSTEGSSPVPAASQIPSSPAVKEENLSKVPVESPAPVPKDEATKLRNDLRAAERVIISVHEKTTARERLEKMSPKTRTEYERAISAFQQGYLNTAEYSAAQADRIEPNQPLILNLIGLIFSSQQAFDKAEESFARSVTVDPDFREGEYNLSSTAFKKKDYARARKRFEHLASSITPRPNDKLEQLLRYRIYLSRLLEGSFEAAQNLMQQMQLDADTPAFYYAHAAWEFRRGDAAIASQWLDSARVQYPPELNLVFAEALSDVGWLKTNEVRSSPSPTALPSPSGAMSPPAIPRKLTAVALTETTLLRNTDPEAAVNLSLKIGVTPKANTSNGHTVDIRVSFFDLTQDNKLVPTNARTRYQWITANRDWAEPTPKYLVATYVRPKTRAKDSRKYGGYIIRVYFDGEFQDEKAAPVTLLKSFPTDSGAIAPVKTPISVPASPTPTSSVPGSTAPSLSRTPSDYDSATPASSPETSEDAVSKIRALENKWAAAIPHHNAADIGLLLAEDYEAITPTGRKLNKLEAVNRIRNDTDKYESVAIKDMDVRLESPTRAVATGLLHQRGNLKSGRAFDRSYLFTDTWVKTSGQWLCVHSRTQRADER
jgi:serine/threonine protein kinase/tetratricopeptide (TPR) repeat protein/ketosteroid isomerase-like protein